MSFNLYVFTDIWPQHKNIPESKGLTNWAGTGSPEPRPPEVSDEEKEVISEFKQPLNALVQNCTLLHNIIGPACIFLRQGFSQARLVCMQKFDLEFSILAKPLLQPFTSSCGQTNYHLHSVQTYSCDLALVYVYGPGNVLAHGHVLHNFRI